MKTSNDNANDTDADNGNGRLHLSDVDEIVRNIPAKTFLPTELRPTDHAVTQQQSSCMVSACIASVASLTKHFDVQDLQTL